MHIAVVNHSPEVSASQTQAMCRAIGHQLRYDYAPAWEAHAQEVTYYADPAMVPAGAPLIGIFKDADQPGALGYHTEGPDLSIEGKVFTDLVLTHGGAVLDGALSVCSVLSHEVLELVGDPRVNAWADTGRGQLVAWELCDPVEADVYPIGACTVSNFVLPAWFDPQAAGKHVAFDHMGSLLSPFSMTRGGYMIVRKAGIEQQVFGAAEMVTGEDFPEWKLPGKTESMLARTARRLAG